MISSDIDFKKVLFYTGAVLTLGVSAWSSIYLYKTYRNKNNNDEPKSEPNSEPNSEQNKKE